MESNPLSLYELNLSIKNSIIDSYPKRLWAIAEISDFKVNKNGHCYIELIQKDENSEIIIAKARATIWKQVFRILKPYFETTTGQILQAGIKILISVTVEFHEVYGLSLNIHDIEPEYTIGDLARQKEETVARLKEDGVFTMNKELTIPVVPQRIAIISSETAAGYKDFSNQLTNNPYNYHYSLTLFPSIMQGDAAETSIIETLELIYSQVEQFDLVAIIRGGGAKSELNCFNNYLLAYNIAQFPIPILTGIGHEQDETITDLVAHTKLKTPTAVAEYIINKSLQFDGWLDEAKNLIINIVTEFIDIQKASTQQYIKILPALLKVNILNQKESLNKVYQNIISTTKHKIDKESLILNTQQLSSFSKIKTVINNQLFAIDLNSEKLIKHTRHYLSNKQHMINIHEQKNNYFDPSKILKRGYSITYSNNKILKNIKKLKKGDILHTQLYEGIIESEIKNTSEKN